MKTPLFLAALLLVPVAAHAITVTPTGSTADVTWTEPTANADASPLTDLARCNVYAAPTLGTEIKFPDVPASALTGGATKTVTVGVAKGSNYTITVSCTDLVGNESGRTPGVTLDALPPNAPR